MRGMNLLLWKSAAVVLMASALTACVVPPVAYDEPYHHEHDTVVIVDRPPPPPPRVEYRGYPPVVGYVWLEGRWHWGNQRYQWVPGRWVQPQHRPVYVPRPDYSHDRDHHRAEAEMVRPQRPVPAWPPRVDKPREPERDRRDSPRYRHKDRDDDDDHPAGRRDAPARPDDPVPDWRSMMRRH